MGSFQFLDSTSITVRNLFDHAFSWYAFLNLGVQLLSLRVIICLSLADDVKLCSVYIPPVSVMGGLITLLFFHLALSV